MNKMELKIWRPIKKKIFLSQNKKYLLIKCLKKEEKIGKCRKKMNKIDSPLKCLTIRTNQPSSQDIQIKSFMTSIKNQKDNRQSSRLEMKCSKLTKLNHSMNSKSHHQKILTWKDRLNIFQRYPMWKKKAINIKR